MRRGAAGWFLVNPVAHLRCWANFRGTKMSRYGPYSMSSVPASRIAAAWARSRALAIARTTPRLALMPVVHYGGEDGKLKLL